jgi:hypothetical protein
MYYKGQTMQWSEERGQKDKQWSINYSTKMILATFCYSKTCKDKASLKIPNRQSQAVKKNRHYVKKNKDNRTSNDMQNTTQKTMN